MKRVFLGALAVVALMGGGCAGGSGDGYNANGVPDSYVPAPMASQAGADPVKEAQVNWSQLMYQVMDGTNCPAVKNYLSPDLRAGVTDADCAAAFARMDNLSNLLSINWDTAVVSADKKKVTLQQQDGTAFGEYVLAADGVWYMNTRFWEAP